LARGFLYLGWKNLWRFHVLQTTAPILSAPKLTRPALETKNKQLTLFVIGTGHVGSALLDQLAQGRQPWIRALRVAGIVNRRHLISKPNGIDLRSWRDDLPTTTRRGGDELIDAISALGKSNTVVVDCTASAEIVGAYESFIRAGAHIVTPNKKANVLPWQRYQELLDCFSRHHRRFLYATNVGAGLPVLSTLADLVNSGDTVRKVEGIFSGTLSYLFNRFDGSVPFSAIVREASERGFTEPDPRVDLSGADVAAKLLVIARQLGWKLDLEDIRVESLLKGDRDLNRRYSNAAAGGKALRYVARFSDGQASASLESLPKDHPLAGTRHTDNVVAFHTDRYSTTPLVIQGPGAGPEVTAAGVLADLSRL
jgi:aspartokinase/homoserine dehydrogenase 1